MSVCLIIGAIGGITFLICLYVLEGHFWLWNEVKKKKNFWIYNAPEFSSATINVMHCTMEAEF